MTDFTKPWKTEDGRTIEPHYHCPCGCGSHGECYIYGDLDEWESLTGLGAYDAPCKNGCPACSDVDEPEGPIA